MGDLNELIRRMDEALDGKDIKAALALCAEDAVVEFPGREPIRGRDAIKSFFQMQFDAARNSERTLLAEAVSGSTAMREWSDTRTMTGPLTMPDGRTIPATGKRATHKMVTVVEAEGDLIKSVHFYFDRMEVLAQLGLAPTASAV